MNSKKIVTSTLLAFILAAPLSGKAFAAELRWMPLESVSSMTNTLPATAAGVDPLVLNDLLQKVGNTAAQQDNVLNSLVKQQNDMSTLLTYISQQQQAASQANFLVAFLSMTPTQQQSVLSLLTMSPEKIKAAMDAKKREGSVPIVPVDPKLTNQNASAPVIQMDNTAEAVLERLQRRDASPVLAQDKQSPKKSREQNKNDQMTAPIVVDSSAPAASTPIVNSFSHTLSVYCKPGVLSQIRLQQGEEIEYIGGGDLSNWYIDKVVSMSDGGRQWNLYIKPLMGGISTNIIITTDKNTYQLLAKTETPGSPNRNANSAENLNYGYKINGSTDGEQWTIYDDGVRTYIKMPSSLGRSAPELYVLDSRNALVKTEYKQFKGIMVIDRLFDEALISLGKKTVSFRRGL